MCAKAGREKCTEDKPILPSAFFFKKIFAHFLEKILTFLRFFSIFVPYQLGCARTPCSDLDAYASNYIYRLERGCIIGKKRSDY